MITSLRVLAAWSAFALLGWAIIGGLAFLAVFCVQRGLA